MTLLGDWVPSEHTVVAVGVVAAAVLLASAALVKRDAWVRAFRSHHTAVKRSLIGAVVVVVAALAVAHLNDLEHLLERVESGDPAWLAAAVGLEIVSFGGYVVLTRVVHGPRAPHLDWMAATELTLAGVVATRVFSAGGAGGIAFTGWVLHHAGMSARVAGRRLTAFMMLLYSLYIGALIVGGLLVVAGVLPNVPRLLGVCALVVGLLVAGAAIAMLRIPADLERRAEAMAHRAGAVGRIAARLSTAPQVLGNGARVALAIVRERPWVLSWPAVWWAFDVATLWAVFHAFGDAPAVGTLVLSYFLGQMGNLLPLPGGVGGTEGGMVGAFAASGVDAGLAVVAVVTYQVISTYLPAVPGLASYVDLRRRMKDWDAADRGADQVASVA